MKLGNILPSILASSNAAVIQQPEVAPAIQSTHCASPSTRTAGAPFNLLGRCLFRRSSSHAAAAEVGQLKEAEVQALMKSGSEQDIETLFLKIQQKRLPTGIINKKFQTKANKDNTLLHLAGRSAATPDIIRVLIELGADCNITDSEGQAPLHRAAVFSINPAVITALIEGGAQVDACDTKQRTSLHLAARHAETPEIVLALLKAGAQPDVRNQAQRTPLHVAARFSKSLPIVNALIAAGAAVDALDRDRRTPLYWAAEFSEAPEIMQALIAAYPGINVESKKVQPPIQTSAECVEGWDLIEKPAENDGNANGVDKTRYQKLLEIARQRSDDKAPAMIAVLEKQLALANTNAWALV